MPFKLITADDYKNAPSDPGEKFAYIEALCRERLYQAVETTQSNALDIMLAREYMETVRAAAEALGIPGLPPPNNDQQHREEFDEFQLAATRVVTKIHIQGSEAGSRTSVQLSEDARKRIETKIALLRKTIEEADIPQKRKDTLKRKLDELSIELVERRLGFGTALLTLSTVVALASSALADAPQAVKNIKGAVTEIVAIIGAEKVAEEREAKRLGAPPKALAITDQRPQARPSVRPQPFDSDLDDEVPF
jgi:hypothetical protein